jgi:hypothetical protein
MSVHLYAKHIGTQKFALHLQSPWYVFFVCCFGVKQHAHHTESQNNAAFLATSYESVIEGVS